jgi:dihydropteroate synthase
MTGAPSHPAGRGAPRGWGSFAQLPAGRTLVMGVLNLTPDSFSDGGAHPGVEAAVSHALAMVQAGADIVDVGGESTRPGADPVEPAEEQRRIMEVLERLAGHGVVVSVDTKHARTARAAIGAGAQIVNDVSGLGLTEEMIEVCAAADVPYILTHARGDSATMDSRARYDDVVEEVRAELLQQRERLLAGGLRPERIILDPGLGFAKGGDQDWRLLAGLDRLTSLGHPVLVAASRKRFIGTALAGSRGTEQVPASERDTATAVISALAAERGAWAVRVHDVAATADALAVTRSWLAAQSTIDHQS